MRLQCCEVFSKKVQRVGIVLSFSVPKFLWRDSSGWSVLRKDFGLSISLPSVLKVNISHKAGVRLEIYFTSTRRTLMRMVNSKIIFEFLRNVNFSLLATLGSKENLEFTIRVKVLLTTKYCQSRPFALRWRNFKSTSVRNVFFKNTSWGSGLTVSTQIQIKCCRNFYCVIHCLQKKIFHAKSKDLLTDSAPLKEPLKRAQPGSQDLAIGRGPHRKLSNWSLLRPWQWRAFCEDPCRWWSLETWQAGGPP